MIKRKFAFDGICNSFFGFSAILWLGLAMPCSSFAQTDSVKKAKELNEVSIRAVKLGKRQLSASPLQILSGKDLERISSLSVADAIRFFFWSTIERLWWDRRLKDD